MNNNILYAAMLSVIASPMAGAEAVTKAGPFVGKLDSVEVNSMGNTKSMNRRPDQEAWTDHGPLPIEGNCSFTMDGTNADFACDFDHGDYQTDTHAKVAFMNIKSTQSFFGWVQTVTGSANWDAATKTLTYANVPDDDDDDRRDAGGASTTTMTKDPTCDEADSRACKAFFKTSSELEGLELNLTFSDDLSSYKGTAVMIQFGGSGLEAASSRIFYSLEGTLE